MLFRTNPPHESNLLEILREKLKLKTYLKRTVYRTA